MPGVKAFLVARVTVGLLVALLLDVALLVGLSVIPESFSRPTPVETVLSIVAGALISVLTAQYYARRSSEELKTQTAELRRLGELVLKGLQAGTFELIKDAN